MPVSIPRVGRNKPVSADSVGRSQLNVPSNVENVARVGKAVVGLAEDVVEGVDNYNKAYEKQVKEDLENFKLNSKNAGLGVRDTLQDSYNALTKGAVDGSDYADRYLTYQDQKNKAVDYALKNYGVAKDPKIQKQRRAILESAINAETKVMDENANEAYFVRDQARKIKITEDTTRNRKNDAAILATKINPSDPKSFEEFDKNLNEIDANVKSLAYHTGATMTGKDGQPIYSDVVGIQSNKSKAEAIQSSIENLLAIGQTDKAKAIYSRYKDQLALNNDTKKLNEVFAKSDKEKVIKDYVKKYENLREDIGIEGITKTVPTELQDEAIERLRKTKIRQREDKNRMSGEARNTLLNKLDALKKSGNVPLTVEEFEDRPENVAIIKRLEPNDRQAVRNEIGARNKVGDFKAYSELLDSYQNGEMKTWTPEELKRKAVNLSQKEWTQIEKRYNNSTNTNASGLKSTERTYVLSRTKNALAGQILQMDGSTGRITQQGRQKWYEEVEPYLQEEMDKLPKEFPSSAERNKAIEQIALDAMNKFKPKPVPKGPGALDKISNWAGGLFGKSSAPVNVEKPDAKKTDNTTSLTIEEQKRKILKEKYNK